jgi:GTP cyclohydrolase I
VSVEPLRGIDIPGAERAARSFLRALGVGEAAAANTARGMTEAYAELLTPRPFKATTFPNDGDCDYSELVIARGISFVAACEEHALPFVGVAHVGYVPNERVLGLSKLGRVVDFYAHQLQRQHDITNDVRQWIDTTMAPAGAGVVIEAEHLCDQLLEGAAERGQRVTTSSFSGVLRHDPDARADFLARFRG